MEADSPMMVVRGNNEEGVWRLLPALRIGALVLSLAFAALLIYTISVDGSPFRASLLTPWMTTTLIDYYMTALPFYIWIYLRSRTYTTALLSIVACVCLGSVAVWLYVFVALWHWRAGQPVAVLLVGRA